MWHCFNSQPPEGGWQCAGVRQCAGVWVSTHSRPKAAGKRMKRGKYGNLFQLTAARRRLDRLALAVVPRQPFQLTAARRRLDKFASIGNWCALFQLTAARRRLEPIKVIKKSQVGFQLTAARRRLEAISLGAARRTIVSTHSRPKAAGPFLNIITIIYNVSTHSRPKAAGYSIFAQPKCFAVSTHSRPKAAGC